MTLRHFHVAGVALGNIHLRLVWQAWYLATSTFVLRGRCGPYGTGLGLVALLGSPWSPVTPATPRHFCVAGVALGDIHLRFVPWQNWYWATSTFVLRSRRGTYAAFAGSAWRAPHLFVTHHLSHTVTPRHFCVASVALGDIHLRFVWHAWYLVTSTFVLRSRRGTYGTGLGPRWSPVAPRTFAWQAWHNVAGVVLGNIQLRFPWEAWHSWHLAGSGDALGRCWSPVAPRHFCVAGVALGDIDLRFAWQAWHLATATFVLRSRRGHLWHCAGSGGASHITLSHHFVNTNCHIPSFTHIFATHHLCHTPSFKHIFATHHLCHAPSFTHKFVTHHIFVTHCLSHTHLCHTPSLSHTIFHTHLCHTVTHHLSHTQLTHIFVTLSHTIFHTHLCHTHTHHLSHTSLSHTIFHTPLCHTPSLSHTIFHTQLCHTPSFTQTHTHTDTHTHRHTQLFHTQHCHTPFSHTTLSHTIFHTQSCHTQLFTYNLLTHRSSTTSFVYPAFPVPLELCRFCLIGRS